MSDKLPAGTRNTGILSAGVDIGGTKLMAGVVGPDGTVLCRSLRATPHRLSAPNVVEDMIASLVAELQVTHPVGCLGVGAAGFVDLDGSVRFAPHLPWRNEPLQAALRGRLGIPVVVNNDANTAARAEMRFGAGRGFRHALCVTLGTGIGGALVVDGRVFRGAQGFAGEFGHMQVVPNGRQCECGQTGCWEQYSSGAALVRAAREAGGEVDVTGPGVTAAARSGRQWALEAFERVGSWLGVGLAGLVSAFDPEIVVIGGGLSDADDLLLVPARDAFATLLPGVGHRNKPSIVRALLGPDAGFVGAADLARATLQSSVRDC